MSVDRCIPRTKGGPQAQRIPRPKYSNGVEVQVLTKMHNARDRVLMVWLKVREVNNKVHKDNGVCDTIFELIRLST